MTDTAITFAHGEPLPETEPGTVEHLAKLMLVQTAERLQAEYVASGYLDRSRYPEHPDESLNVTHLQVSVKPGPKYTKVDIGPAGNMSGKYMVENETGTIFGIKGYGQVHKGHRYGTLATVAEWYWGGYVGRRVES
jgi:hypothetical protein